MLSVAHLAQLLQLLRRGCARLLCALLVLDAAHLQRLQSVHLGHIVVGLIDHLSLRDFPLGQIDLRLSLFEHGRVQQSSVERLDLVVLLPQQSICSVEHDAPLRLLERLLLRVDELLRALQLLQLAHAVSLLLDPLRLQRVVPLLVAGLRQRLQGRTLHRRRHTQIPHVRAEAGTGEPRDRPAESVRLCRRCPLSHLCSSSHSLSSLLHFLVYHPDLRVCSSG